MAQYGRDTGFDFNPSGQSQRFGPTPGMNYGPVYGPSANPAAGPAGFNNPQAPAMNPQMAAQNGGNSQSWFNGQNWNPTYENHAGYNPSQYATVGTANTLAGALGSGFGLGANVQQTRNAQGFQGPPPQTSLNFGGDSNLNAGLLAERYKKYDHATADEMTRAELALMGPRMNPNADSQGGSMGSWSMFQDQPGGFQNLGGGQNIGQFVGENQNWRGATGSPLAGGGANMLPAAAPRPVHSSAPMATLASHHGQAPSHPPPIRPEYNYAFGGGGDPRAILNYAFGGGGGPVSQPPAQDPRNILNYAFGGGGGPAPSQPTQNPQAILNYAFGGGGNPPASFNPNRTSYGGFGQASHFQGANSLNLPFLQALMGGGGGMPQGGRGRLNPFGGGRMSGYPSFLQGHNQSSGNGFTGPSPFHPGSMSNFAGFINSFQRPGSQSQTAISNHSNVNRPWASAAIARFGEDYGNNPEYQQHQWSREQDRNNRLRAAGVDPNSQWAGGTAPPQIQAIYDRINNEMPADPYAIDPNVYAAHNYGQSKPFGNRPPA